MSAGNVNDVKFPEFTAKLVTDTFDALIDANLRQIEAFQELAAELGDSLSTFINKTKDDISGDEILGFLTKNFPALEAATDGKDSSVYKNRANALTKDEADKINAAVKRSDVVDAPEVVKTNQKLQGDVWDKLMDAIAVRISNNKYSMLKEMTRMGMMRLVVNNGVIETRLNFSTYSSSYDRDTSSDYYRSTSCRNSGSALSRFFGGSTSRSTRINVSTDNSYSADYENERTQIFGGVKIFFKTDYQPLSS